MSFFLARKFFFTYVFFYRYVFFIYYYWCFRLNFTQSQAKLPDNENNTFLWNLLSIFFFSFCIFYLVKLLPISIFSVRYLKYFIFLKIQSILFATLVKFPGESSFFSLADNLNTSSPTSRGIWYFSCLLVSPDNLLLLMLNHSLNLSDSRDFLLFRLVRCHIFLKEGYSCYLLLFYDLVKYVTFWCFFSGDFSLTSSI